MKALVFENLEKATITTMPGGMIQIWVDLLQKIL